MPQNKAETMLWEGRGVCLRDASGARAPNCSTVLRSFARNPSFPSFGGLRISKCERARIAHHRFQPLPDALTFSNLEHSVAWAMMTPTAAPARPNPSVAEAA